MSKESIAVKSEIVGGIKEKIAKAKTIAIVDYRGLTVKEDTEMRNELRKANVEYRVMKNRLVLRALNECGYKGLDKALEGPSAIAISYDDVVAPAKIIADSMIKTKKMAIKGGVIEGKTANEAEMKALASIPAKPVLLAQLLGLLTSPMRSLAVAVSEVAKKQA